MKAIPDRERYGHELTFLEHKTVVRAAVSLENDGPLSIRKTRYSLDYPFASLNGLYVPKTLADEKPCTVVAQIGGQVGKPEIDGIL